MGGSGEHGKDVLWLGEERKSIQGGKKGSASFLKMAGARGDEPECRSLL